ncbi:MAG: hypothetical protein IPG07_11300 [Crocinitomicaceae bacterium]|nr:hypothetical protein [Crocinitomicaceae bacterium]
MDALYLNGCTQSTPVILNPGPSLPFSYTIIPDTCGYSLGEILIDTVGTNLAGGSGSYSYTFNNGAFYGSLIDTLNLTTGTYSIGLQDITLGCFSNLDNVVVNEITDVDDESFVFDSFCALDTPVPASVATSGGVFSFDPMPIDGATINGTTGLIAGYVMGNTYSVVYTVGICNEKDTIVVQAVNTDIPSFTFPDFCAGSPQSITPVLPGGTFSFDPIPTDGATINSATGVISGSTGGIYGVNYLTNGFCPDDSTVSVTVFPTPPAPQIIATDSIYCGTETPAMLSVVSGTDVAQWMIGSSTSTVLSTADDFTPASLTIGSNYIYVVLSDGGSCLSAADSI